LKKEVTRAAKFGETAVVALSHFQFSCGYQGTLLLLGKFSGELAKFYKQAKLTRKKERDYAKGTCYFEIDDKGQVQMHIALQDGKGKPDKLKKNGKVLFKKLGFNPQIIQGELGLSNSDQLSSSEVEFIEEEADYENDQETMQQVYKKYQKACGKLEQEVC